MNLLRRLKPRRLPRTLSSLEAYARWAASYPPRAHNALMQAEEAAMRALLPPLAGRTVLDLACGTGRYGLLALESGARLVLGVDNSRAMLRAGALRRRAEATSEALPLANESVDVVLCGLALGHLPDLDASMSEIGRVLIDGGVALVSDFHPFLALGGQRRTFSAADGRVYTVAHYAHLYADYHRAARRAGLVIAAVAEPGLSAGGPPVVIVYCLQRERRSDG